MNDFPECNGVATVYCHCVMLWTGGGFALLALADPDGKIVPTKMYTLLCVAGLLGGIP